MFLNHTRLKFVFSPNPEDLEAWAAAQDFRIEIKSITFDGKNWFLWFVPDDKRVALIIKSGRIDLKTKKYKPKAGA